MRCITTGWDGSDGGAKAASGDPFFPMNGYNTSLLDCGCAREARNWLAYTGAGFLGIIGPGTTTADIVVGGARATGVCLMVPTKSQMPSTFSDTSADLAQSGAHTRSPIKSHNGPKTN